MESFNLHVFQSFSPTVVVFILLGAFTGWLYVTDQARYRRSTYSKHPRVGKGLLEPWLRWETPTRFRLDEYEAEGYNKYNKKGQPFVLRMYGLDVLILPRKYLSALRTVDRETLNFAQFFSDIMNMDASVGNIGTANRMEIDIVSKCINPNLTKLVPLLDDEAQFVFDQDIGKPKDWKTFKAYDLCSNLVHQISNRVLVGKSLCRNKGYMKACNRYAMSVFISGIIWNFMSLGPFRNWIYWLGGFMHRYELSRARKYLVPVFEKRMAAQDTVDQDSKPLDGIQWMTDMPPTSPAEVDPVRHANRLLHLTFAGTGTSISLLEHLIWQYLLHPDYVEPLRQDISQSLSKFGGWHDERALTNMNLLDSFVRETLRIFPPGVFGAARTVMGRPLKLDDDLTLLPGERIAFAMHSINIDPDHYENSTVFDGRRFLDTQSSSNAVNATTINEKYQSFGYGKQACPGRFYAVRLVKLLFGRLLDEYDIKFEKVPDARPTGMTIEGMYTPNISTKICLRYRK